MSSAMLVEIVSISILICLYIVSLIKNTQLFTILENRYPDIIKKYGTLNGKYLSKINAYSLKSRLGGLDVIYTYKLIFSSELAAIEDKDIRYKTKIIKMIFFSTLFFGIFAGVLVAILK